MIRTLLMYICVRRTASRRCGPNELQCGLGAPASDVAASAAPDRLRSGVAARIASQLLAAGAGADVEVRHRPGLVEQVPHRVEVGLGQLGQAEQLGLVRQGEAAHALVDQPGHLLDRQVHVPDRQQRLGKQPAARLVLDVDEKSL